jgi:hypothetical protein
MISGRLTLVGPAQAGFRDVTLHSGSHAAHALRVICDPGAHYADGPCQAMLERHGIVQSMSRCGNCLDNAPMKNVFAALKVEHVHHPRFSIREVAKAAVFEHIEVFYNRNVFIPALATEHRPRHGPPWREPSGSLHNALIPPLHTSGGSPWPGSTQSAEEPRLETVPSYSSRLKVPVRLTTS